MQEITLITPPSYHMIPGHKRFMVIGAPSEGRNIVDTFNRVWPDMPLSIYHTEGAADESLMHWLVYNIRVAHEIILNVGDDTAMALGPIMGWLSERDNVWLSIDNSDHLSKGFGYVLKDNARNLISNSVGEAIELAVRAKYLK